MSINQTLPNILLVDDIPANLMVLEKLISRLPIKIFKTTSGEEAVQLALENDFMLILLDVQMPDMDGYQVLEVLSWDEKTKYIPVIFITANYRDEQHKLKGYESGAIDYLYKPINEKILLSKIKVFIDLYEQQQKNIYLQKRYESIILSAGEGIIELDINGSLTYVNPAAEKLLSRQGAELLETSFLNFLKEDTKNDALGWAEHPIYKTCKSGNIYHKDDTNLLRKDETLLPVEYTATPLHNEKKEIQGIVIVFNDITLRKTVEDQLTNLALYDHLTKLPNRLLFEKTIAQTIARSKRSNKEMALMFLDLDHFKNINDTLGHDVGDMLLKGVAERLQQCIRKSDTVARLGGDEFAIVLDEIMKAEDAGLVAEKVITSLGPPFQLNGHEVFASTSIGIAIYPVSGADSITLTKNADIAMYQAKQEGRNNYRFFTETMNEEIIHKLELIHNLRYAIEKNELFLHYQPQLKAKNKKISGLEALLRWQHPSLGLLQPNEFIYIAEETGLIKDIGAWAIEVACMTNKKWQKKGLPPIKVSVNLSSTQLLQSDVVSIVKKALAKSGLESQYLEIEITESSLITNQELCLEILNQLHGIGVNISIDDFGTGYSSLNYLKRLPVDSLKIDKSFVSDIATDASDAAIVKAVIALAHNLNLNVIAEGVETTAQESFLVEHDCDEVQGFLYSKPMPDTEVEAFLNKSTAKEKVQ